MQPPRRIDGAWVLEWAWSDMPFGEVPAVVGGRPTAIYGMAICQYEGSSNVCRFSCDKNWETKADVDYSTIEEAKAGVPYAYQRVRVIWHSTVS